MTERDKVQTSESETEAKKRADDIESFFEQRGTLGLGLPNEGLAERIEKQREEERRNR
ncbi:hypothetical protein AFIC_001151 [[Pseudomonas] carboxydohydrogena]|uniref:Uncharacterized protein n=1 Tax=Afipia carboxydohydrogena TaxID=290 RepID=A0ABY8BUM1_AFICR|nr:hypothetical protein [[Pseudomonas] carboxydohydrogena]WEF52656.1 hypothetical protein AFIC_001151 [[Pseudomonas] carboxydohydrogena]